MKAFIYLAIFGILIIIMFPINKSALFNEAEQPYIENVDNLTTAADLEDFFNAQCSIYIDNVYGVFRKFFSELLPALPAGVRSSQIQLYISEIDKFLSIEDIYQKVSSYDAFTAKFPELQEEILEYDSEKTLLTAQKFNDIFVAYDVDNVLSYVNDDQNRGFIEHTGLGIRRFLINNRPNLNNEKITQFKSVVDEFLESETFVQKRTSLKLFLKTCHELLE